MAKRVEVVLVDDLVGGEAVETVRFAIDGSVYEIDLGDANARTLREALAPYVAAARKVTTSTRARRRPRDPA